MTAQIEQLYQQLTALSATAWLRSESDIMDTIADIRRQAEEAGITEAEFRTYITLREN